MSGPNNDITNTGGPVSSSEPSMEEILASIRRILRDDQTGEPATPQAEPEEDEILVLDSSMVVKAGPLPEVKEEPILEGPEGAFEPAEEHSPHLSSEISGPDFPAVENETLDLPASGSEEIVEETPAPAVVLTDTGVAGSAKEIFMSDEAQDFQPPHGLVGDEASNAAVSSIGSLIRSISSERQIAIGRAGLTLEDLVREELRPLLKSWLDSNLPSLVDRIVRAEIQRVIERTGI